LIALQKFSHDTFTGEERALKGIFYLSGKRCRMAVGTSRRAKKNWVSQMANPAIKKRTNKIRLSKEKVIYKRT
jgi:hypothetical protein